VKGVASCFIVNGECDIGPSCGPTGGCFVAGTLVETDGGPRAIESIVVGDKVLSASGNGETEYAPVEATYRVLRYEYYVINGHIRVTAEHPFKVSGGWATTEELQVGCELVGHDGQTTLVSSIVKEDTGVRAYNIEVGGTHTFFADGVLVHNKPGDPGS